MALVVGTLRLRVRARLAPIPALHEAALRLPPPALARGAGAPSAPVPPIPMKATVRDAPPTPSMHRIERMLVATGRTVAMARGLGRVAQAPHRRSALTQSVVEAEDRHRTLDQEPARRASSGPPASEAVASALGDLPWEGYGTPMTGQVRSFMESYFRMGLGGVRLHTGPGAARAASRMGARAFTLGHDIYFGRGGYEPGSRGDLGSRRGLGSRGDLGSRRGLSLLGHELSHVAQGSRRPAARRRAAERAGAPGEAGSEREALRVERDIQGRLRRAGMARKALPGPAPAVGLLEAPVGGRLGRLGGLPSPDRAPPYGKATDPVATARRFARQGDAGRVLPSRLRQVFEPALGVDLARVRLHADLPSAAAASAVRAEAFTVGRDVYFGAGRWSPGTRAGRALLAHELTHVAQNLGRREFRDARGGGEAAAEAVERAFLRDAASGEEAATLAVGEVRFQTRTAVDRELLEQLLGVARAECDAECARLLSARPELELALRRADVELDSVRVHLTLDLAGRSPREAALALGRRLARQLLDRAAEAAGAGAAPAAGAPAADRIHRKGTEETGPGAGGGYDPNALYQWAEAKLYSEDDVRRLTRRTGALSPTEVFILRYTNAQILEDGPDKDLRRNLENLTRWRPRLYSEQEARDLDQVGSRVLSPIEQEVLRYTNDQILGGGTHVDLGGNYRDFLRLYGRDHAYAEAQGLYDAMKGAGTKEEEIIRILGGKSRQQIDILKERFQRYLGVQGEDTDSGGYDSALQLWLDGDLDGGWYEKAMDAYWSRPLKEDHEYFWSSKAAKAWNEFIRDSDAGAKDMIRSGNWLEKGIGYFNQAIFSGAHEVNDAVKTAQEFYMEAAAQSDVRVVRWAANAGFVLASLGGSFGTKALDPNLTYQETEEGLFDLALLVGTFGAGKLVQAGAKTALGVRILTQLSRVLGALARLTYGLRRMVGIARNARKLQKISASFRQLGKTTSDATRARSAFTAATRYEEAAEQGFRAERAIAQAQRAEALAREAAKGGANAQDALNKAHRAVDLAEAAKREVEALRLAERAANQAAKEAGWLNNNILGRGYDATLEFLNRPVHMPKASGAKGAGAADEVAGSVDDLVPRREPRPKEQPKPVEAAPAVGGEVAATTQWEAFQKQLRSLTREELQAAGLEEAQIAEIYASTKLEPKAVLAMQRGASKGADSQASHKIRQAIAKSDASVTSHEAYTLGELPSGGKAEVKAYLKQMEHWHPERRRIRQEIFDEAMESARAMAARMGNDPPTIVMMRGNTAAGKSYTIKNANAKALKDLHLVDDAGELKGAINPDDLKSSFIQKGGEGGLTHGQVHTEGSSLTESIVEQMLERRMSMVLDKRFAEALEVQKEVLDVAKAKGYRVIMVDVDTALANSAKRVLARPKGGSAPRVKYDEVEKGFKTVRGEREVVAKLEGIDEYYLYHDGKLVASKQGGDFVIVDKDLWGEVTTVSKKELELAKENYKAALDKAAME